MIYKLAVAGAFIAGTTAQQVGMQTQEYHLNMPIKKCGSSGCQSEATLAVIVRHALQRRPRARTSC
jgi:hypothetical protein